MRPRTLFPLLLAMFILASCTTTVHRRPGSKGRQPATQRSYTVNGITYYPIANAAGYRETGMASWYGGHFHGRKTASGETYDMFAHTAAHKTLPMGTMLLVRNLENNKQTVVRVNDRGPFTKKRIIDLTYTAGAEIGLIKQGIARVEIVALEQAPATKATSGNLRISGLTVHPDFNRGKFYVQVGAFARRGNARTLARRFADKGRDVIIQQYPASGGDLYRVLVYSGTSLMGARTYRDRLERAGYTGAVVIAR